MKTMMIPVINGHIAEIEDIDLIYCAYFAFVGDDRIVCVGLNHEGRNGIFFWKKIAAIGVWKYHSCITVQDSKDGHTRLSISSAYGIRPRTTRPETSDSIDIIIAY